MAKINPEDYDAFRIIRWPRKRGNSITTPFNGGNVAFNRVDNEYAKFKHDGKTYRVRVEGRLKGKKNWKLLSEHANKDLA